MGIDKNTLVVNFFGGPGSRKSTMAFNVISELKWLGVDCEIATEFAKDKVWENSIDVLRNQFYTSGNQYHRIFILNNKVDVIVTDSPILLGAYYSIAKNEPIELTQTLIHLFNKFNNLNFFLKRPKEYIENGRLQTKEEAENIDECVIDLLDRHSNGYQIIKPSKKSAKEVTHQILCSI